MCLDYIYNPTLDIFGNKLSTTIMVDIIYQKLVNIVCKKYGINRIFDLEKIKKNTVYDKYLVSYPDLNDNNFEELQRIGITFNRLLNLLYEFLKIL